MRAACDARDMTDYEHRETMAASLGMSWDGCDPFEWPELIARANEMATTIRKRPDWQARATTAEAALAASQERERVMREALEKARSYIESVAKISESDWGSANPERELIGEINTALQPQEPANVR